MRNPFTLHRWNDRQWQLYLLVGIWWASLWQIIDAPDVGRIGLAIANMAGCSIALLALHLKNKDMMRALERWAYIMLIWSMSCYLALALRYEGWEGLWHQPNLGVVAAEAVILACVHRTVYTAMCGILRRRKIKSETARLLAESCCENESSDETSA